MSRARPIPLAKAASAKKVRHHGFRETEQSCIVNPHDDIVYGSRADELRQIPSFPKHERSRAASVPAAEPSLNLNRFCPNELRFQFRLTIFEEHRNHLAQIFAQLRQRCALRMRARKSRNVTDE